jgi:hypothetical protein
MPIPPSSELSEDEAILLGTAARLFAALQSIAKHTRGSARELDLTSWVMTDLVSASLTLHMEGT